MKDCLHTTDEQDAALLTGACPLCLTRELKKWDELCRELAKRIEADPDMWPDHDNAPLAIAATYSRAVLRWESVTERNHQLARENESLYRQLAIQERENNRLTFALKRIQINSRGGPAYDIVEKTLSQELIDLRRLLRRIEWADADEHGVVHCPACGQAQMNGHAGDCELAIVMKRAQ
ncbi:MAG: hypothetical protein ACREBU_16090 [Nitrososphaera sp.]